MPSTGARRTITDELARLGVLPANVVVWPKNGIEYYYPPEILQSVFSCTVEQTEQLTIAGDVVSLNGIVKTKNDLATEVIRQIDTNTRLPDELLGRLLQPLERAIN